MFNSQNPQPKIQKKDQFQINQIQIKQKAHDFANQIRQKDRNNKKQVLRKKLYKDLSQLPIQNKRNNALQQDDIMCQPNNFIELLQKQVNDSRFTWQASQTNSFFLVDFLLAKSQNLIRISFKNSAVANDIDEKLLPPKNSDLQLQQVDLPKQFSFRLQTLLYETICKQLERTPGKYKKLPKQVQSKLITFCLQYLKRNTYNEAKQQIPYHQAIINFFTLFLTEIDSPDLRQKILLWVRGPVSLPLIFNSLDGQFLNFNKYSNIYDIILVGLNHKLLQNKSNAVDVLLKSIKMSDYDDIQFLLHNKPQIFISLLTVFENQQINRFVYQFCNNDMTTCLIKAAYCVNMFLWSYDEVIISCLKQGAGYLGAKLICQSNKMLMKQGFQILIQIASIQEQEYKRQAQKFILKNNSIRSTFVWQHICKTDEILHYENIEIFEYFLEFVTVFFANSGLNEIIELYQLLQFPNNRSLTIVLIDKFVQHDKINIRLNILKIFQSIFYYSQQSSQDEQFMELNEWSGGYKKRNGQVDCLSELDRQVVVSQMVQRGMFKIIRDIYYDNRMDYQLREISGVFMQFVEGG